LNGNSSADRRVEIGVVGRPHGVRGSLHVFLHNAASSILEEVESLELAAADSGIASSYRVVAAGRAGKQHVVTLEGVGTREAAEALNGHRILLPRSALPRLDDGEYYVDDLMGLEVCSAGLPVGTVISSRAQGGIEVLTVRGDVYDIEVPLVADYVVGIDLAAARIDVGSIDDLPRTERPARRDPGV
jgi:16S rRNA processing protein RimM